MPGTTSFRLFIEFLLLRDKKKKKKRTENEIQQGMDEDWINDEVEI